MSVTTRRGFRQQIEAEWSAVRELHRDRHICCEHPIDDETAALLLPGCDATVREHAMALANGGPCDPFEGLV